MDEWTVFRLTPEEIARLADAADPPLPRGYGVAGTAAATGQRRHH
jgi:hypothetical protein